ncbi:MAG: hypothetical protein ACFFA4_01075 [Promethearchaeota archaeon]
MLPRTEAVNSEEFIFFIDLISNFLKKKSLMKAINAFIKEKDKYNALTSYGVVLFQKDDNPISVYNLKDVETVLNTIDEAWERREIEQSYLENGLYEILAYIFRKSREARKNYRVIIISDAPSKLSEEYYNALYDLLIKAKKFSAFIDIIRVGDDKFYEDDVKLKVISSETHGGTFYCPNEKLLSNILDSLIQNKKEFKVIKTEESEQVLTDDKVFYERLAVDLISLSPEDEEICDICEQELCPICEAHSDEIHKCYNCNAKYHNCCGAKYSIAKNIGIRHVFRCVQCETLLKLDEEFVNIVFEEDLEEELHEVDLQEPISQITTIEEIEDQQILEEEADSGTLLTELEKKPEVTKKVKIGGFFGQEITIGTKNTNKLVGTEPLKSSEQKEKPISITALQPPKKRGAVTIKLCKICGATCGALVENCPTCGAKID